MLSRSRFFTILTILAVLAMVVGIVATRWGIGTYIDSVAYVGTARNLQDNQGFSMPRPVGDSKPVTEYAPLYPYTLALFSIGDIDPADVARGLNVLLYAVNSLIVGLLVYRLTEKSTYAAIAAVLLAVISPEMLRTHTAAMTEAIFLPFSFMGLYVLALYIQKQKYGYLIAAGILLAIGMLYRNAGLSFIGAGGLGLLLVTKKSLVMRFIDGIVLGGISVGPTLIWKLMDIPGPPTTPVKGLAFHMFSVRDTGVGVFSISKWFVPEDLIRFYAENIASGTAGLILTGVIGLVIALPLLYLLARWLRSPNIVQTSWQTIKSLDPLTHLLLLTIVVYVPFIVAVKALYDAVMPFSSRIMFPIYIPTLVLIVYAVDRMWKNAQPGSRVRSVIMVIMVVFFASYAIQTTAQMIEQYNNGIAYEAPKERNSEIAQYIRALPEDAIVYSTEPSISYLIADRPTGEIPWSKNWYTLEPIETYEEDLLAFRDKLQEMPNPIYIVLFTPPEDSGSRITPEALEDVLGFRQIATFKDRDAIVYQMQKP